MQIKYYNIIFLMLLLILIKSCVEPYHPDVNTYKRMLVVEGGISNDSPPYTIKLSTSTDIYNPIYTPGQNALVSIIDSDGNIETLTETEEGVYTSSSNGMQGETGKSYKIEIETDGIKYESDYAEIKENGKIESINSVIETHIDDYSENTYEGIQFYVNTRTTDNDTTYYLWKNEETYKFNSDFRIEYYYIGYFQRSMNRDSVYTCWTTKETKDIYIFKSTKKNSVINNIPLNYVNSTTKQLFIRYSLLIKQLSVNKQTYNYWYNLKKMSEQQGSLHTSQPYQVKGNVYNSGNHKAALGYFTVAGIEKKRIFLNKPKIHFYIETCGADHEGLPFISKRPQSQWPIYITVTNEGGKAMANEACFDCTIGGGKLEKPDFWID